MPTKEAIYDEQVAPLMAQVLAICKAHQIAMVASFAVPNEEDTDLLCTSALLDEEYDPPAQFEQALRLIYPRHHTVAITASFTESR